MVFLSGGSMHNNVKFVPRDEDIQVRWRQLVFWFILQVGICAFPHVLGMEKSKKLPTTPREDNFWNSPYYSHNDKCNHSLEKKTVQKYALLLKTTTW